MFWLWIGEGWGKQMPTTKLPSEHKYAAFGFSYGVLFLCTLLSAYAVMAPSLIIRKHSDNTTSGVGLWVACDDGFSECRWTGFVRYTGAETAVRVLWTVGFFLQLWASVHALHNWCCSRSYPYGSFVQWAMCLSAILMFAGSTVFKLDKDDVINNTSYLQYGGAYCAAGFTWVFLLYCALSIALINNSETLKDMGKPLEGDIPG